MKINNAFRKISAFLVLFFITSSAFSQVSIYEFSHAAEVYTEITGGTIVATATATTGDAALDNKVYTVAAGTIPFNYRFDNVNYTGLFISTNGFITFGAAPAISGTTTGYVPISGTTVYAGAVSAFGCNLIGNFDATNVAQVRYQTIGVSPYRKFVVQFKNFRTSGSSGNYNFQIRLCETTNAAEIVYGAFTGTITGNSCQVGLRGPTNVYPANVNNRSIVAGTNVWSASVAGTSNFSSCSYSTTLIPASGQIYRFGSLCSRPENLSVSNITTISADLSWTTLGGAGTFSIEYGLNGFTPGTGTIVQGIVTTSASISGLTPTTAYQLYVTQNCGVTGNSVVAGPKNFSTGGIGEDCSTAPLIQVAPDSLSCIGTLITSGISQNGPNAQCSDINGNFANDDTWIKIIAPSNGNSLVFKTTAGTVNDWVLQVWRGCPNSGGTVLLCSDDNSSSPMPLGKLCQNEYVAGETLYVRMWTYSQSLSGNMTLCVYSGSECVVPPSNDECVNPIDLPVNPPLTCPGTGSVYSTKYATKSVNTAVSCAAGGGVYDVWFRFNTGTYGDLQVNFTRMTANNLRAQVLFACNEVEVACWNPADGTHTLTGLNPSANYMLRVWSDSLQWGTFNVCIQDVCADPTASINGIQTVCKGDSIYIPLNLTGTPPWTFTYSNGVTNSSVTTSTNPFYIVVAPQSSTTYTPVSIVDKSCTGVVSGSTQVNVVNKPIITSFSPTIGPVGTVVTVTGTNLSSVISVSFNNTSTSGFTIVNDSTLQVSVPTGATTGHISVNNLSCAYQSANTYTVGSVANFNVTIRILLEGMYTSNGAMHQGGGIGTQGVADSLTLSLAATTGGKAVVATRISPLSTTGYATFQFPVALMNNSYYLVVKTRNSIETWSKSPVLINSTSTTFNFSGLP